MKTTEAIKLMDVPVVHGQLVPVYNKDKKRLADSYYEAVWVKTHDGESKCAMLTQEALKTAFERTIKNPEDIPRLKQNIFIRVLNVFK